MQHRSWISLVVLAILGACSDVPVAPSVPRVASTGPEASLGVAATTLAPSSPALRYICYNTFEVTNTWRVPAALYWRVEDGSAQGFIEVPAGGVAYFDATPSSWGRRVNLFADSTRSAAVATAQSTRVQCAESKSGDAWRLLAVNATCSNTVTVTNAGTKAVRVNWLVPGTGREGRVSVPARLSPTASSALSFDVPNATSVRLQFGKTSIGTVSLPSSTACREGAILAWRLIGAASSGGDAIHSALADGRGAIFTSNGPDYGVGRVWRFDLATHQTVELQSANYPQGKYRKLVYDPDNDRLITYWDGLGQAYALPASGGVWTPIGSSGNSDAYYEGGAFWNPAINRVSLWGGYGLGRFRNTFWALDPTSGGWNAVPMTAPMPWGRIGPSTTVDRVGNRLFVTGGEGSSTGAQFTADQQYLSDLWSLDLTTLQWTNIIPLGQGIAADGAPIAYVPSEDAIYRFGGWLNGGRTGVLSDDLTRVHLTAPSPIFSTVTVHGPRPSARWSRGLHYDSASHRLLLVSGHDVVGWTNDIWELRLP